MGRKVALDCHKRSVYVVIHDGPQERVRRRFTTDADGEAALLALIQPTDQVVLEASTGAFRWANRLESVGATVFVLDPQATRAVGLRGKKTDYRDCRALLEYLGRETMPVVWRPTATIRELRQLTRERFAFNQSLVRLKNRVRAVLLDEGLQPSEAPWEPAGQEWLRAQTLRPRLRRLLERELAAIAVETALKAEQEEELAQLAVDCPEAQRLLQVPGFGAALAMMWLGEVGDLTRFPSADQLVSYAGLNPRVHRSGEQEWRGPISKAGRSQLRWIMVEVAWRHVQSRGPEAHHFDRMVAQGKPTGVAIVALAHRLLRLVYLLLRREEPPRELDLEKYEAKLTRLAAHRPVSAEPEVCNRDWAAERVEALTGQVSPRRASGKQVRLRRPPRPVEEATDRAEPAGRKQGGGSTGRLRAAQEMEPTGEVRPCAAGGSQGSEGALELPPTATPKKSLPRKRPTTT